MNVYKYNFNLQQRQQENDYTLTMLKNRLNELDQMEVNVRHKELIVSFLAGNIFDWGAKEIAKILDTQTFGFEQAKEKIPSK